MKCRSVLLALVALAIIPHGCANSAVGFDTMVNSMLKHDIPEVHARDHLELNDFVLLDTREISEYRVSHLQGARWVGYNTFRLKSVADLPKHTPLLVYCSIGYRSEKIGKRLRAAGYTRVTNLVGGIFAWVNSGKPVYDRTSSMTEQVHGFNRFWGFWVTRGQVVYE